MTLPIVSERGSLGPDEGPRTSQVERRPSRPSQPSAAPVAGSAEVVATLLGAVRRQLAMDVAYVSEWGTDDETYRFLDGDALAFGLEVGARATLATGYGLGIIEGALPEVVADARADARTRDLEITRRLGVGAYASIPLRCADGRVMGMLTALHREAAPALEALDPGTLGAFSTAISAQLERLGFERAADDSRAARVHAALQPDAFHIVYQPVVDLATRHVVGFEALARFTLEPRRGPDAWFAEAWALGSGVELELAAIERAIAGLDDLPAGAFLTLNVAPRTLVAPGLLRVLGHGSLARIVLEITEHAVVEDYALLERALAPLRARGARLAVDDVGAGFSSFQHILQLRPDFIKLDLYLSRDVDLDPARRALVAALVSFSVEVGVVVLAEGIERRAEFHALRSLGVMLGQGYLLGRPTRLTPRDVAVARDAPAAPCAAPVLAALERDPLENVDARVLRALRDPARVAAVRATGLFDTPPDAVFDRLTALASTLLAAPVALISLLDDRRQFVKSATTIDGRWEAGRDVPLDESLCLHAITGRAPLRVNDLRADAHRSAYPGGEMRGVRAYMGAPLLLDGRTPIGTLCVLDDVPREWSAHEVALLEQMAASVVAEMRLRASLREVEHTRRSLDRAQASAQEHLVAQEDGALRFRQLVESNPSAVWVTENGVVVEANRAAAELFGYERATLVGLTEQDLFPAIARDTWDTQLSEQPGHRYETLGLRSDGAVFSMTLRDQTVEYGGRPVRLCAVLGRSARGGRKTVPYIVRPS